MKQRLLVALFICTFAHWHIGLFAQNVGIGTTTPQAKLDVNGDFKLQTGVAVNSISADSSFSPGSDEVLPTQKAVKRYMQKGTWLPPIDQQVMQLGSVVPGTADLVSVYVRGSYAYTISQLNRLAIFDISSPGNIIPKASTNANLNSPISLVVKGNYAYVASFSNHRLCIYDISNPDLIIAKGTISTNLLSPQGLFVAGNYAYVASSNNSRLCIFDVTDPDNIVAKGFTNSNLSSPASVVVNGNYAFVGSFSNNRVCVFDISNPNSIGFAGYVNEMTPFSLAVQGNYVFVISDIDDRLAAYDISNPPAMVFKGATNANLSGPRTLHIQGNYAYVSSFGNKRICIYDITDPTNIVFKGFADTNPGFPTSVFAQGNYIYTTEYNALRVFFYGVQGTISQNVSGNLVITPTIWETNAADNVFRVSGNVGIGTNTPSAKLEVTGSVLIRNDAVIDRDAIVDRDVIIDGNTVNNGSVSNGLRFGGLAGGEAIASKRTVGGNQNGLDFYTDSANRMVITNTGNVGIGVSDPSNKLSVSGGITVDRALANNGSIVNTIKFGAENSGEGVGSKKTAGGNENGLDFYTNYVTRMSVTNGGFVGIGTTSPTAPLEVSASTVSNIGSYAYLAGSGTGFSSSASSPVSIRAAARIVAAEFDAVSDQRIKRNITTSPSQKDLATLLKIRVTDYQLKDSVYNGNAPIKGFIAQELETVMPQAVHTNADYVPDIYCLSTSTQYNEKDKTLKISLCRPHQLKVGDKVKAFAGDGMQEQYVAAINSENEFTLSNWEIKQAGMNPVEKIFVWGKWVTDFHTVDYNQVFSMGISAMQQLAKENEQLKTESEAQKKVNQSLQQQIDELKKLVLKK